MSYSSAVVLIITLGSSLGCAVDCMTLNPGPLWVSFHSLSCVSRQQVCQL